MPLKRKKKQEFGLRTIGTLGVLQCLVADRLCMQTGDWATLEICLSYFVVLFAACYGLSSLVKRGTYIGPGSKIFRDFTLEKGLVMVFLGPAVLFWIELVRDYHEALPILGPFTGLAMVHIMALLLAIVVGIVAGVKKLTAQKPQKKRITRPLFDVKDVFANVLYLRFLYRELKTDQMGKLLFFLVPGAYLLFVALSLASLATLYSSTAVTSGSLYSVQTVKYELVGRYGPHDGKYCLFDVDTGNRIEPSMGNSDNKNRFVNNSVGKVERFVAFECPPCPTDRRIVVNHNPIDYLNRNGTTATCGASLP